MTAAARDFLRVNVLYAVITVILIVASFIAGIIFFVLGSGEDFPGTPYGVVYNITMAFSEFASIAFPALVLLMTRGGRSMIASMRLQFKPVSLIAFPAAIGGYFAAIGLTTVWMGVLTMAGLGQEPGLGAPTDSAQLLPAIFVIGLVPAFCEEFAFRGLMLPAYEKHLHSPLAASLLTGLVFGLMHGQVTGAPGHIMLGVVMGLLVWMTDSLWTGIFFHFTNNSLSMVLSYLIAKYQFNGSVEDASAILIEQPLMMMFQGAIFIFLGLGGLAAMLALAYAATAKKRRAFRAVLPQARLSVRGVAAFLPWLPLVVCAPVVILKYVISLITMLPGLFGPS